MNEIAPLKHIVEPGEYHCIWTVPVKGEERQLHGSIDLRPNRQPRGSTYGGVPLEIIVQPGGTMIGYPQKYEYPVLRGEILSGLRVLLIDAVLHVWAEDRAEIDARAAIVGGFGINHEPEFERVRVQVTGLDSLSGIGPIKSFTFPRGSDARTWSAEGQPDAYQEWGDDAAKVELDYVGTASIGDPYRFQLAFSPVATIRLVDAVGLDEVVDQWVNPVQRLASLCIGRPSSLAYLALGLRGEEKRWAQVYGSGIEQEPYAARRTDIQDRRLSFSMAGDSMSLLDLVRRWQMLTGEHHPLIETYGAFLTAKPDHPRSRFLLLVQALEGLYGYEHSEKLDQKLLEHRARREEVLSRLAESGDLLDGDLGFIKKSLSNRPPSILNRPLKWAIAESLPLDLSDKIASTDLVKQVMDEPNCQSWLDALRILRNQLAHGTKGYDVNDLYELAEELERVVRAHALRIIGCNSEILTRALQA